MNIFPKSSQENQTIVCDKNLRHQQNLSAGHLAILELWTNHRPTLEQHFDLIGQNVGTMQAGEYRVLSKPGS